MLCDCCGRDREVEKTITLDAEQIKVLQAVAGNTVVKSEYHYCKPCWRINSDRDKSAKLLRGFYEAILTRNGYSNANKIGDRFETWLLEKAKRD